MVNLIDNCLLIMLIENIFQLAIKNQASDIHLVAGLFPVLRVNGNLMSIKTYAILTPAILQQIAFSLLDEKQRKIFLTNRDIDFSFSFKKDARFRVNLHYEKNNIGLTARVINNKIPSLDEINLSGIVYKLLNLQQGLILITGPTGCGKSTSLAAMINYINANRRCKIVTLEDPIEFLFKSDKSIIIQRQLGSDIPSFASGLKYVLRQDPNVIMVGEMRDLETISTTITLAETGHLVLATLHTYSASQTIDRIIDIFPPYQQSQIRMQLSMTLAAIFSQKLLPSMRGGQIAAREILLNTSAISNLIRENKIAQIKTIIETSSKDGMISLDRDLKRLYKQKLINKEIAQRQMSNPELLDMF